MSKIVLVNPDVECLQKRFETITLAKLTPQPPLGLCYLAASLEASGHMVTIIDGYAESLSPQLTAEKIIESQPTLVGITLTCVNVAQGEEIAYLIKQADASIMVVVGGPEVTLQPEKALNCEDVDFAISGEGEYSLVKLVDALEKNADKKSIPGLIFRKTNGVAHCSLDPVPVANLDDLPLPSRHLLDWENYNTSGHYLLSAKRVMSVSTSRGCPYRCTFCSSSFHWNRTYRSRSAISVVDEIEKLIIEFGADGINFREDNFMVDKRRVREICKEILKRNIKISWLCETRVDNVDRPTMELMREAGLAGVWCGVESGSPKILKQIKKGYSVEQIRRAFSLFNSLEIKSLAGFMIGFPNEEEDDIWKTYNLAIDINPTFAYFQTYVAFPKGELYDYVLKNGLYCDRWRDVYRVSPRYVDVNRYPIFEFELRKKFDLEKRNKNEAVPKS
jgi:magnesium-protoporphyrin IX monomethyl ester (oxidative) cyclase